MKFVGPLLAASLALIAQPVSACSFSWAPGYSPKRIPHREDVWKVSGDFSPIDAKSGEIVQSGEINLTSDTRELLGRLDRKGRKPIMTKQYYSEFSIECGANLNPLAPGSGTFWLENRRDRFGRYRLLMWRPAMQKTKAPSPETAPIKSDGNE